MLEILTRALPPQRLCLLLLTLFVSTELLHGQSVRPAESRASLHLESVRKRPLLALAFLREMPKGGDLHNHLGGAIYAENLIAFAAQDKLCVDRKTLAIVSAACDNSCDKESALATQCATSDQDLYNSIVDAWSVRNWERGHESGHDHFFSTFSKFEHVLDNHTGEFIAVAMNQAAADHVQYLELMHTIGGSSAAVLGAKLSFDGNFSAERQKLIANGFEENITQIRHQLDRDEQTARKTLACGSDRPDPGCQVDIRYLYQVLRAFPPEQVFAQILTGFELASVDPRVVGLNLVMPEDSEISMRDFDLHMKMIDYLHRVYPKVHIALHAGELAMGLVPPDGLRFHIRESIEVGHAERIGHGVDVMNERDPFGLLHEMADRKVLVEICLTSNDVILSIKGKEHPFPIYRQFKVPVTLATDDEGVSRTDMTHEYLRALVTYNLSYHDLKQMARESLEHSFLPGASLWADLHTNRTVAECAITRSTTADVPVKCARFLDANEKAQMQWKLEAEFKTFERKF